ncbi:MAG: hypothetical protein AAF657_18010 [Acidobacteriota bacterium]
MAPELSPEVRRAVDLLFPLEDHATVVEWLAELEVVATRGGPFVALERAQAAAVKVSHGDLDRLRQAVNVGLLDLRDLVSAAGFWSGGTHERWNPRVGEPSGWERGRERIFGVK